MEEQLLQILTALSSAAGPPGGEAGVARVFASLLEPFCTIKKDPFGSVTAELNGRADSPRILLAAHLDEVGFMVRSITAGGMVRLQPLGGWPDTPLAAHRFVVHTDGGEVTGLVPTVPPHHAKEGADNKSRETLLDVGCLARDEVLEMGIQLGDLVTPEPCFTRLGPKVLMNKAWDDRAGLAAMAAALTRLREGAFPGTVLAAGTVQEEVGARGAFVLAGNASPDLALVVEGTPADDLEGLSQDEPQAALGSGVQIRWFDPGAISHRPLTRWLIDLCEEENIPHQVAVRKSGGTDARHIQLQSGGVPTTVLGIPVRYAHSPAGLIHLDDFFAAVRLIEAATRLLDDDLLARLTSGD